MSHKVPELDAELQTVVIATVTDAAELELPEVVPEIMVEAIAEELPAIDVAAAAVTGTRITRTEMSDNVRAPRALTPRTRPLTHDPATVPEPPAVVRAPTGNAGLLVVGGIVVVCIFAAWRMYKPKPEVAAGIGLAARATALVEEAKAAVADRRRLEIPTDEARSQPERVSPALRHYEQQARIMEAYRRAQPHINAGDISRSMQPYIRSQEATNRAIGRAQAQMQLQQWSRTQPR